MELLKIPKEEEYFRIAHNRSINDCNLQVKVRSREEFQELFDLLLKRDDLYCLGEPSESNMVIIDTATCTKFFNSDADNMIVLSLVKKHSHTSID